MEAPPVQYVTTSDGYSIAYAVSGQGRPFVMVPLPFSHIQLFWAEPTFLLPWLQGLTARFKLVQYDGRGQGMSTRGLPESLSPADFGKDLEAVVERLKLDRFVLHGTGTTWGHVAIRYAAAHPERIEALILVASAIEDASFSPALFQGVAEEDWDLFLLSTIPPGASLMPPQTALRRIKQTVTKEDYMRITRATAGTSASDVLAQVTVPTLVLHPQDFSLLRPEASMRLAAAIPNARFVMLEGATALGDPVQGLKAIDDFLASLPSPVTTDAPVPAGLSLREVEVLRLIAAGRSNQQIADALVISQNTVARHVSNIFDKTGAANRADAASYAHRHALV